MGTTHPTNNMYKVIHEIVLLLEFFSLGEVKIYVSITFTITLNFRDLIHNILKNNDLLSNFIFHIISYIYRVFGKVVR